MFEKVNRNKVTQRLAIALGLVVFGMCVVFSGVQTTVAADRPALLLVHSYNGNGSGTDCGAFNTMRDFFGRTGRYSRILTLTYYEGGINCDIFVKGRSDGRYGESYSVYNTEVPAAKIAADIAWYIDDEFTSKGQQVDAIGTSFGGVLAALAVGNTQYAPWPKFQDKTKVATFAAPYRGNGKAGACGSQQCRDVEGINSPFTTYLGEAVNTMNGNRRLLPMGSSDDNVVAVDRATAQSYGYNGGLGYNSYDHGSINIDTRTDQYRFGVWTGVGGYNTNCQWGSLETARRFFNGETYKASGC